MSLGPAAGAAAAAAASAVLAMHGGRVIRDRRAGLAVPVPDVARSAARRCAATGRRLLGGSEAARRAPGIAVAAGVTAWILTARAALALAAAAIVLVGTAAHARGARRRREAVIVRQLPAVAASLAEALRAGLSLRQALARVAWDAPDPVAGELGRVARDLRLGARVEDALRALSARVENRDVRLMVAAIEVQRLAGGDLARALDDLSTRLGDRARLARELRALTAQARLTAWIVGAVPVAAGASVEVAAPGTLGRSLLAGPGLVIVIAALALYATAAALVLRLARVAP